MKVYIRIIRTKNFSARLIHVGMWLYAVLRGLKPHKISYNHCEVGYEDLTSGAIVEGVKTRKWEDYIDSFKEKYFKYLEYEFDFSDVEWLRAKYYLDKIENQPYEFENFWYHTIKIFTGKWKGSTKPTQIYCYEHGIRVLNCKEGIKLDTNMNPYEFKEWVDSQNI